MSQAGILTVTLNPAVDLATTVPQVIAGPKLRCAAPRFDPGGGGVNVARTIRKLDGTATALVAVGGAMGDRLLGMLAGEDVPTLPVAVSGETRQSFAVTDATTQEQFRFSVPGDTMTKADADALLDAIAKNAPQDGFLVLSGGVAPGLPDDFLDQIITANQSKNVRVIADTHSAALDRLISDPLIPLAVLRIDDAEASEAAGHLLDTPAKTVAFAQTLLAHGVAKTIIVGRGAEGSLLISQAAVYTCAPPIAQERSKIGAGDAFVGALTLALARNVARDVALQWGVAVASATVSTDGTALCERAAVVSCLGQCQVSPLP